MRRRTQLVDGQNSKGPAKTPFTAADVWLMLSSPVYAYGINLLPQERVAEEVMKLNARMVQVVRETGATFTLNDLAQQIQALLKQLEDAGTCCRS